MKPLKTLLLNPPSFENFDGGASSRWPATREIESYWYPVWLAYPAGMLEGSRLLDAPPHHVSAEETIEIAKNYEFLVLFTSTVGWHGDHGLAEAIKRGNPSIKIAFVGPPVTTDPDRALNECPAIDFVCRREFDFSVVEFANGKPLPEILGVSYKDEHGVIQHNPDRAQVEDLDELSELPAIEAALPAAEGERGEVLPVGLRSAVTEVGTLELRLVARDPQHAGQEWKLEFSVRDDGSP